MKMSTNKSDKVTETQAEPKLRNIHEEKEAPPEKPKGADIRLKLLAIAILCFALFVGVSGVFTKISLSSKIEDQKKTLAEMEKTATDYGITKDDDGNFIVPDIASGNAVTADNIPEGDKTVLDSFVKVLLNWRGQSGYNEARQTLINEWGFSDNCKLLTSFMPATKEELNANMSVSEYSTFSLSEGDDGNAYFLICTIRNTINGTSASGTVGLQIKLNKEHKVTNVTAQTLS